MIASLSIPLLAKSTNIHHYFRTSKLAVGKLLF
jgi:hypothetical protein